MIDCKECVEYAHMVLARGEIKVEDIAKLALDRHILKGCDKVNLEIPNVIVMEKTTPEFRKGFIAAMTCVYDMGKGDHTLVSLLSVVDSILKLHATQKFFPDEND